MKKLAAAILIAINALVVPGTVSAAEVPDAEVAVDSRQELSAWPRIRDTILGRNKHKYHRDRHNDRHRHDRHHHDRHRRR